MAKRTAQGRTSTRGRKSTRKPAVSASSILEKPLKKLDLRKLNGVGYKNVIRQLYKNPVSLYLAGSVGAFFLGRFAYKYYQNHPEVSEFIRDNFDTVEGKLREFRGGSDEDTIAAH